MLIRTQLAFTQIDCQRMGPIQATKIVKLISSVSRMLLIRESMSMAMSTMTRRRTLKVSKPTTLRLRRMGTTESMSTTMRRSLVKSKSRVRRFRRINKIKTWLYRLKTLTNMAMNIMMRKSQKIKI